MNTRFLITMPVLAMFCLSAGAQTGREWDDVSVFQVNREKAHTLAIPMPDEKTALAHRNALSPYYLSLDGTWKFHWVPDPAKKPAGFESPGYDDSAWDDITVPSTWQVYGVRHGKSWDKPLYTNVRYPFTYDPKTYSVMADRPDNFEYNNSMKNPVGSYRRNFTLPATWKGRDVYVRFNGAGHGFYVWVNGQFVGYAEDSYTPSEFKVTPYVKPGVNSIAVQVYRFTSGSFLEDQDYWRMTGIMRDVFLWSAPKTQIRDYFAWTSAINNDGSAKVTVKADITGKELRKGEYCVKLLDKGNVVYNANIPLKNLAGNMVSSDINIPGAKLWSAEQPYLYDLIIELKEKGKTVDIRSQKLGIKMVGVNAEGAITINGKPIKIHGVDRHDFSCEGGRTITPEETLKDLLLMKRLNINAIRTSHYPDNPYFYDMCDSLGLYVLAEANLECHGNMGLSSVPLFRAPMVERNVNHVLWMRNHACIFMWSFGNESGPGENFKAISDTIHALDPTRLRHYEGNSQWSDVTSTMYANVNYIESVGKERAAEAARGEKPRPHVQCENTHSMGNAMGNQREYYNLYEKYPALAGEFIWDWKDQGLLMPVPGGKGQYWAYGGDFNDYPNDANFCTNGVVFADDTYSAKALNVKKIYQPADFVMQDSLSGKFLVKNKMAFANLSQYDFRMSVLKDGIIISQRDLGSLDVPGGGSREISLGSLLPPDADVHSDYAVRFSVTQKQATPWAEAGYEVAAEQFTLRGGDGIGTKPETKAGALTVADARPADITVSGPDFRAVFSRTTGQIVSYERGGRQMLDSLRLNAFRAPTDNDKAHMHDWDAAGLRNLTVKAGQWKTVKAADGSIRLSVSNVYTGRGGTAFTTNMEYHIFSDGTIAVASVIDPQNKGAVLPRIGYRLEMPAAYENYTWYGRGPWDNYADRKESCFPGLYHSTVTKQWTGFVLPQENGNKEDVRYIALTDNDGRGIMVTTPARMSATVGHWRPEDFYIDAGRRARHPYEVPFTDKTVVSIDAANRALGNASCGPDVLPKYELRAATTVMCFVIRPIDSKLDDSQLTARSRVDAFASMPVKMNIGDNKVSMGCDTKGAKIYYSTDGRRYTAYTGPFSIARSGRIYAYSSIDGKNRSMVTEANVIAKVDKSGWRVVAFDSEEPGHEAAANAIDGKLETIWHSQYKPAEKPYPHFIQVDLGKATTAAGFIYTPRQDYNYNGIIRDYELYFSNDGKTWGAPVAKGAFDGSTTPQTVKFVRPAKGRYVLFKALATFDGGNLASMAELDLVAE